VLAVLSPNRSSIFPKVPTIPNPVSPASKPRLYGLVAPAATPKAIVDKLHDEVQKACRHRSA